MRSNQTLPYSVSEIRDSECPRSAITQKSFDLVQIVVGLKKVQDQIGAAANATELPGYLYDAARVIRNEEISIESARIDAEQAHSR